MDCYRHSLEKAAELRCESVAFPLIATGVYGFPKDRALQIAFGCISSFLMTHEMKVILVVFDRASFQLSERVFSFVDAQMDDEDAALMEQAEYGLANHRRMQNGLRGCSAEPEKHIKKTLGEIQKNRKQFYIVILCETANQAISSSTAPSAFPAKPAR